ncbi:hemin ABC transporter substrate-binding protein [Celerinatantimonas sp. YJH-8]|uniref:heme/hemin ABC transporter substrate-binding protein n=1 Tax=Celerinatantimonas sp. YJH-8 TaxID=3228714 RepID=UPI0038CA8907
MKQLPTALLVMALCGWASATSAAQRLVSIGGMVTEIVYALGAGNELVATDTSSIYPTAATQLPQVGYQRSLSVEGVLSQHPNLLLLADEAGPKNVIEQLKANQIKIVRIHSAHTPAEINTEIRQIAKALNRIPAGEALITQIEQQLAAIKPVTGPPPRLLFILQMGGSPMIAGQQTAPDELFKLAGAVNAAGDISGFKPLTPEALIAAKPDAIVVTTQGSARHGGSDKLWQLPAMALTQAGKHQHLIQLDALLALALGPRTPQAVAQIQQQLPKP